MKVTKLEHRAPENCTYHAQQNGIVIGIHPVTDKREVKDIFKTDLRSKGVLPILLVAENRNSSSSFVLAKDNVSILDEVTGLASVSRQTTVTSETAGGAISVVGAAAISAPLLAVGMKMASDATVIQHNLGGKEFYTRTLGPGQNAQGFLYFQHPKESPPVGIYHVIVHAHDSTTGGLLPFDFKMTLAP